VSRRAFIKRTAALAVGSLALPHIVPSSALGADGHVAPSNRITLGFIGVGKQGRGSHVNAFRQSRDVHILAVCDVETGRLKQAQAMVNEAYAARADRAGYKGCATYADYRELCARDDIDAVCIATPDHLHALPCIEAVKSGKDVYCEKPLTRFIEEGRAIVDVVRRYGRVFQTGSQQRSEYGGKFRRAAELVRAGAIGELTSIDIGIGGFPDDTYGLVPESVPPTLDWDRWQGPAPWRPYNQELCPLNYGGFPHWRYFNDYAGGSFSDFGAHHFDIAQWALGTDHTGPVAVCPPDGRDVERMTFVYSQEQTGVQGGLPMYHGGAANCVFNGTKGRILVGRGSISSDPPEILQIPLTPDDDQLGRGRGHREDWLHCIRTREKPIADVEIGHRTNTICQIGNICHVVQRPLKWDPVDERFLDDDEANRLLSRSKRSPWRA